MCHTHVIIPGLPTSLSPPTTFVDLALETSQILLFISIVPWPQFSTSFLIGSLAVILPHSYPSSSCIKDGLGPGSQKAHLDPRGPCRAQPSACDMADNSVSWWSSAALCQLRSADVSLRVPLLGSPYSWPHLCSGPHIPLCTQQVPVEFPQRARPCAKSKQSLLPLPLGRKTINMRYSMLRDECSGKQQRKPRSGPAEYG